MKKLYYSLLVAIGTFQVSVAQLNYTFSAASGTYTPIVGTAATLTVSTTFSLKTYVAPDEGFVNNVPIGFTFRYNNIDHSTININTNGFASFSNFVVADEDAGQVYYESNLTTGPTGLSSVRPILAPLWDDLALTNNSNLTYITTGTAPNRIFTIQWADVKWPFKANASSISFQLKLYETTNIIEFIYQPFGFDFEDRSASIGITGTATGTNNFLSLDATSNDPTASSTIETDTINTTPFVNQVYRFTPAGVLPVTLSDFSGEKRNGTNVLSWSTQTEQNNSGFELQHSENGITFSKLAFVASKAINGNSTSILKYELKDLKPFNGNNYYRLKQIDKDGVSTLSRIVLLKGADQSNLTVSIIYPNPLKNDLNMTVTSPSSERIAILVNNIAGKIIKKQSAMLLSGDNKLTLRVAGLTPGIYMIKLVRANGYVTAVSKFVKQ